MAQSLIICHTLSCHNETFDWVIRWACLKKEATWKDYASCFYKHTPNVPNSCHMKTSEQESQSQKWFQTESKKVLSLILIPRNDVGWVTTPDSPEKTNKLTSHRNLGMFLRCFSFWQQEPLCPQSRACNRLLCKKGKMWCIWWYSRVKKASRIPFKLKVHE